MDFGQRCPAEFEEQPGIELIASPKSNRGHISMFFSAQSWSFFQTNIIKAVFESTFSIISSFVGA